MATLQEQGSLDLLEKPFHAVISTHDPDDSIHSAVVWVDVENGIPAVNSAVGRRWPTNLERNPQATLLVYDPENAYDYVEIRGHAEGTIEGADDHIDRLAKKYLGKDEYPFRKEGEQRIKFVIRPDKVRRVKQ